MNSSSDLFVYRIPHRYSFSLVRVPSWESSMWFRCRFSFRMVLNCPIRLPVALSDQQRAAFKGGSTYLKSAMLIADLAVLNRVLRWKFRPKLHYLDHQFREMHEFGWNPRFFQCWTHGIDISAIVFWFRFLGSSGSRKFKFLGTLNSEH